MLDQSLLQSHFIGRDGFRWWIGQVPPIKDEKGDVWGEQANKQGWGIRVKVRILGYHPLDPEELSNQDLPWAQVMLPTTAGSGSAFYGVNSKVGQGDMVIGFFMDGDNAQIPIIMGVLGKTKEWSEAGYKNPFSPFTGFTENIKNPDSSMRGGKNGLPTNEDTPESQGAPPLIDPKNGQTSFSGTGQKVIFANTCENTTQSIITTEIDNLLKWVDEKQAKLGEYREKVQKAAQVIKSALGWLINEMFKKLELFLVGTQEKPGIIPRGIQLLYTVIYGSVLAATGDPAIAHQAGVTAEKTLIAPVQLLEKALVCIKNAVLDGLTNFIVNLLESLIENVKSFVTCAAEQFIGVILNSIVDNISGALTSALDGALGILGVVFNVASFLRGGLDSFSSLFDCGQSNTKCDGTKEWIVGVGPKSSEEINIGNIFNAVNEVGSLISGTVEGVSGAIGDFQNAASAISSTVDIFNGNSSLSLSACYTGYPKNRGPARIKIFGGGGTGATAVPICISTTENPHSIIGSRITNKGSGYRFPPFVEIIDDSGIGYGAKARATINSKGELQSIYMVSIGVNYPPCEETINGVIDTVIQSSGLDYSPNDTAIDDFGNEYDLIIDNGKIISARPINTVEISGLPQITVNSDTGFGAVISPVFGSISPSFETQTQIDCPV